MASEANATAEAEREIEVRLTRARVLRHMHEGTSDELAARDLAISIDEYRTLYAQVVAEEGGRIARLKPEEVYAEYVVQMRRIVSECMLVRRMAARKGSFGPAVQALKVASDTIDKSIARGQELGVIRTNARPTLHMHAHLVAELDNRALRSMIVHEVDAMHRLVRSSGDADFLDLTEADITDAEVVSIDSTDVIPPDTSEPPPSAKPAFARGGLSKVAGGKAVHRKPRDDDDDIDAILKGG